MLHFSPSDASHLAGYSAANIMETVSIVYLAVLKVGALLSLIMLFQAYMSFLVYNRVKYAKRMAFASVGLILLLLGTPWLVFFVTSFTGIQWGKIGIAAAAILIALGGTAIIRKIRDKVNCSQTSKACKGAQNVFAPLEQSASQNIEAKNWIEQIRAVNDEIPDKCMSRKIDRIEEITAEILEQQEKRPAKATELRKFLDYYLPTTLKLLNAYAELGKVSFQGEYIAASKQRIEGMMDKVVEGFELQLDRLFKDEMLDITSDVTVLEQMLRADGLSNDEQMPRAVS